MHQNPNPKKSQDPNTRTSPKTLLPSAIRPKSASLGSKRIRNATTFRCSRALATFPFWEKGLLSPGPLSLFSFFPHTLKRIRDRIKGQGPRKSQKTPKLQNPTAQRTEFTPKFQEPTIGVGHNSRPFSRGNPYPFLPSNPLHASGPYMRIKAHI